MSAAAAGSGPARGGAILLRRVPLSVDLLDPRATIPAETLRQNRIQAVTHFHLALGEAKAHLGLIAQLLVPRALPEQLLGTLVQPDDGAPAARVQVSIDLGPFGLPGTSRAALTDDHGAFLLPLPKGKTFPEDNTLTLSVHGANGTAPVAVRADRIAPNGIVAAITLPEHLAPLPVSVIASLRALLPADGGATPAPQPAPAPKPTTVTLGEDGGCQLVYQNNTSVDRFPFGVFVRLVEPRTSILAPVFRLAGVENGFYDITNWGGKIPFGNVTQYVDRVPLEQPISVDGFRDDIVGVRNSDVVSSQETVPMAGTLGLGYVVRLAQLWTPKGLALGDLVYSLPLAPGEQQRVAIFERRDTSTVLETEALTVEEQQAFQEQADTSALGVFASAFNEVARGGSSFQTSSSNWGVGGFLGLFGGGGGGASSSGSSTSWLEGQRDYVSSAAETTHSSVQRQAAARRSAFRTGMRLASASESENVTTKVITNHNHTRALTLQYWEVQRLFEVTTTVEGVTLVCMVPLEVVRFLPAGQHLTLTSATMPNDRQGVLDRYAQVLKHADILAPNLPSEHRYGLTLLKQFAADPAATVQAADSLAEDVIQFTLTGTVLPFEEIYVSAVTRQGIRLGPVRLAGPIDPIPSVHGKPEDLGKAFSSEDALVSYLRDRRAGETSFFGIPIPTTPPTLRGSLAVPPSLGRNDIIGFELSRRFEPFTYELVSEEVQTYAALGLPWPATFTKTQLVARTIRLSSQDLEQLIGGPRLGSFAAEILTVDTQGHPTPDPHQTYVNDSLGGIEMPADRMPIPAAQLPPELRYSQLLQIEQMLQHVVRNTIPYSKIVWQSLTAEERAIMLEQYTIGVPPGGVQDETQTIPLLNCVENRVLGFYGNSMIMPFIIPRSVADTMGITSGQIQDMLTAFHKNAFDPPRATIALPTRGVLGEAVLGHCPSAEKIDLTRFWNWADSPADTATAIADVTVPTTQPSLVAGAQAPGTLGSLPALINNFNASGGAPTPQTGLLQALASAGGAQKDFSTDLTGATQLAGLIQSTTQAATSARSDAVKMVKDLNAQALATAGNIIGGIYGGNPTAGSEAAKAVYGTGGGDDGGSAKSTGKASGAKSKGGSGGAGGSAGSGSGAGGSGGSSGGTGGGSGSSGTGGGSGSGGGNS